MTFGSLFAGIGGFDLGFERAGLTCKWQVEIDDYATRVLAKHWPHVHRERDIRECGAHNLAVVDVICGGFPCQDISLNNRKAKGITGEQSGLWTEQARIIRQLMPRYAVVENVPALTFRGLGIVLRDLSVIGYNAEWHAISCSAFGSHHKRKRMYIVASRADSNRIRLEGGPFAISGAWSHSKFTRLVQHSLRICVPAGKYGRVSDGISRRVDRLRCLGNAVVPQVAEWIGSRLMEGARLHAGSAYPVNAGWNVHSQD